MTGARRADARHRVPGEVSTLFTRLRPVVAATVPKGMTEELLGRAVAALREAAAERSPPQLGADLGVSRVTARRDAEHLVDSGRARRGNRYSGTGRPEVTYAWVGT